ncbi:TVP38/TMEM64 family protein [Stappia sp. GBMRC 2046]|uniref:TVP38/TMEM64 family membrane protein n=1 Tax=Stappia sediminis TaxID=2692190 RepID=A0A7X3LWK3_9HYPH|nr:VTT domain-containing protein [Stappia sediminis]MXN66382.1 TVP38/TMEM64 family protein [Stappia sediminis]
MNDPSGPSSREGIWPKFRRWAPICVIALLMAVGFQQGWHEHLTLSSLIRERARLLGMVEGNLVAAMLTYIAVYIASVALSFPGASFLTILGGFLFGWLAAGTLTAIAATVGACLIFVAARSSLGHALKDKAGPFVNRLADGFREDAFHYLLFLRLTPIFPFWLVNIAPALFRVPLSTYIVATFFGILPGTYAYSFVGAGLDSVIEAQEAANPGCAEAGTCRIDLSALVTKELVLAFAALGVVSLIPVILKKWRAAKRAHKD